MSRPVRLALLAKGRHGTGHLDSIQQLCGLRFIALSAFMLISD